MHRLRGALLLAVLLCAGFLPRAEASEIFCRPELQNLFCSFYHSLYPTQTTSNFPGRPGFNASAPWTVQNGDSYTIPDGALITPGSFFVFGPSLFVFGTSQLRIVGSSARLNASVFVCDQGSFTVANAQLRLEQERQFQFYLWLADQATMSLTNTTLTTVGLSQPPTLPGNWFMQVRGNASLTIDRLVGGRTLHLDVLELATLERASTVQKNSYILEEAYIASSASMRWTNFSYFDLFFEACPFTPLTVQSLPPLCSLSAGECLTAAHRPTTWTYGPPDVNFLVDIQSSYVFSWAASTYGNSSLVVRNVNSSANLAIGLGGIYTTTSDATVQLSLATGSSPQLSGLEGSRSITLENSYVLAWHVWPTVDRGDGTPVVANYTVDIQSGSQAGDLLGSRGVTVRARDTVFDLGQMNAADGNPISLSGGSISYQVRALSGSYFSANGGLNFLSSSSLIVDPGAGVFLYDVTPPATLTLNSGSLLHMAQIISPAFGSNTAVPFPVPVNATLNMTANVVVNASTGGLVRNASVSIWSGSKVLYTSASSVAAPFHGVAAILPLDAALAGQPEGYYTLALSFTDDHAPPGAAPSGALRTLVLGNPVATSTTSNPVSGASSASALRLFLDF